MNEIDLLKRRIKKNKTIIERFPAVMNTCYPPVNALINILKRYNLSWEWAYFGAKNKMAHVFYSEDILVENGKKMLRTELQNPGYYDQLLQEWKEKERVYYQIVEELEQLDLSKLNLEQLKDYYVRLCQSSSEAWAVTLTANNISVCADVIWIPAIVKKYGQEAIEQFATLSAPKETSLMKVEEGSLLKIADKIEPGAKFKDLPRKIIEELERHAKEYHWINNNYGFAKRLDAEYFFNKIKEIKVAEDKKIKVKINFNEEEKVQAEMISKATLLHDRRKKNNLICVYHTFELFKEISKYIDYSSEDLKYLYFKETVDLLSGKDLSKEEIEKRKEGFVVKAEVGNDTILSGKEADEMYYIIDNIYKDQTEIKGMCACKGKVQGKVKVILNASEDKDFQQGDILVASMTRPEFTTLMRKAAAIVTDEGGLTCHAAVVSRELGVPCIIGTKFATQVLKDNDLVEVNANEGTVRKIE